MRGVDAGVRARPSMTHLASVGVLNARDEKLELTVGVERRHFGDLMLLG